MSRSFEFDPAERFTAGAIGEPGERTFYIQARDANEFCTFVAEKEQVFLLARELRRILSMLPTSETEDAEAEVDAYDLELIEPLEPDWRIGSISIEFDPERDRVIVLLRELDVEAMRAAAEAEEEEGDEIVEALGSVEEPEVLEDDDEEEDRFVGDAIARIVLTRGQVSAMAEHALEVIARGRPRCEMCGEPMNAGEPHACAAMNGHRKR